MISMLGFPLTAAFGVYLGLCKKCRRTPILLTPVPPHQIHLSTVPPRRDSVAAPGGEVDLYARVFSHRSVWRTFGLHLGLCKKCRQTPIFTLLVFPHSPRRYAGGTLPRAGAQCPCCGGVEDGSTDAERSKKRAQALAECRESALRTRCGSSDARAARRGARCLGC